MYKPFKSPDLNAPRKRKKAINLIAYPDEDRYGFFAAAKEQYPSLAELTNKQIAEVIKAFLIHYADEVVNNRYGVRLPGKLGAVIVGLSKPSQKTRANNIDYAASRELGIQVSHRNGNTDGYIAKINYFSNVPRDRLPFHHRIRFKACRKLKRAVSAVMKTSNPNRYIFFSKSTPVRYLFRKRHKPPMDKSPAIPHAVLNKIPADYDEFRFD